MAGRFRAHTAPFRRLLPLLGLAALAALIPHASAGRTASLLPASFVQAGAGPAGGTVWVGRIPDPALPGLRRSSIVYLPPHASALARYPVLYLLQGFRGSPWQFASGLQLATVADRAIASGTVRPFIAVAPPAGLTRKYDGEWAGAWESYVVQDVVPWVDAHLPTLRARSQRALAGLSAGGFGAVDIGLRHPGLFETLESWSGYFRPLHDGPFRGAGSRELAAHNPSLLARDDARLLRGIGTRFYLSSGSTADRKTAAAAVRFAGELDALRLPHVLYLRPGGHDSRFWRSQLPEALRYALPTPRHAV